MASGPTTPATHIPHIRLRPRACAKIPSNEHRRTIKSECEGNPHAGSSHQLSRLAYRKPAGESRKIRPVLGPINPRRRTGSPRVDRLRYLMLHVSGRCISSGFTGCRLVIAGGVQFCLHLQPFVGRHGGIALWRWVVDACLWGCHPGPRVHQ
jgi:hypothetical protein